MVGRAPGDAPRGSGRWFDAGLRATPACEMRAYLCVSIDTECDKGPAWRSKRPLSFDGIFEGIVARLQPLFRVHAAKPTYLLSPEVMRDAESADALRSLLGSHELGAHLHGEYAEPGAFEPEVTKDFQRDYPEDLERKKLVYLTDLFGTTFGKAPRSFRAGRFGIGPSSIPILSDLGYEVESSVTPFVDWASAGAKGLSFVGAPTQPYHPDPRAPEKTGASAMLEVPVTIRPRALSHAPLFGKYIEPRWLRPTRGTEGQIVDVAKDEIKAARAAHPERPIVLNAMFHNVEVIAGASPYAQTEADAEGIMDRLAALLDFARREDIRVIGLSDVPELYA